MRPVQRSPTDPALRSGLARWRRGTPPRHGALVAADILLAIFMVANAVLVWVLDVSWWFTTLAVIAAAGSVSEAVREVRRLRG